MPFGAPGGGISLRTGSDSPQVCTSVSGPSSHVPAHAAEVCNCPAREQSEAWHSGCNLLDQVWAEPAKMCRASPTGKGVVCLPQEVSA